MGLADDSLISSSSGQSATQSWEEVWEGLDSPRAIDVAEIPDGDFTAYVRYAEDEGPDEISQQGLHPLRCPIPPWFQYVSPAIYYLTDDEKSRLNGSANPKTIQTECEEDGRVFYAVLAESDGLDHESGLEAQTVIGWLTTFAQDYLGLENDDYELFFSGNRSIHLHTSQFVPGNSGLEWLKDRAETFNEEHDAELDTSIYQRKPQFRLTGVEHYRTGLPKIPVAEDATREEITHALTEDLEKDYPFEVDESYYYNSKLLCCRDSQDCTGKGPIPVLTEYIKERDGEASDITHDDTDDITHNTPSEPIESPVSPYAKTGDGERSVILLKQTGEVVEENGSYYVEAYVREARGGDGSFRRYNHDGHVLLSERDARKWNFESGDVLVILGGQSRNSKLLDLTGDDSVAEVVENALYEAGKDAAIEALELFEYDTGAAGYNGPKQQSESTGPTDAGRIKREIERGEREPGYMDMLRVSCRLLRLYGWEDTWEWVEQTYGEQFDPDQTHNHLSTFVDAYFPEIDPPKPP